MFLILIKFARNVQIWQLYLQAPQDVFILGKDQVSIQGCDGVRHGRLLYLFAAQIFTFRLDNKTAENFGGHVAVPDVTDDERLKVSDHFEGLVGLVALLIVKRCRRTTGGNAESEVRSSCGQKITKF
jgi:hypothetical protein